MFHKPIGACISPLWVSLALCASPLWPQTAQEEAPSIFSDVIEVRVVNVEVVVTDRKGNRITGLKPRDFRLEVDGEEVPIEYFTEVVDGSAVKEDSDSLQLAPAVGNDGAVGLSYLVFVDDLFSIQRDRNRVLRALAEDLVNLGPRDRMSVVAFNGQRLDLLTSWTSSPAELRKAFEVAQDRPSKGLLRVGEQRSADRERRSLREFSPTAGLGPMTRYYAFRLRDQVERSVLAAATSLRSLASPPGRKVMLLLSGGWPFSPTEYALDFAGATFDERVAAGLESDFRARSRLFDPLSDAANLLGYTLYPVDVAGFNPQVPGDASERSPGSSLGLGASGFDREHQVHSSLSFLAQKTGGKALLNAHRDDVLPQVADDTRTYYWLGFTPQRQQDNQRHRISVQVERPGLRARSREGFVDLSRQTEVTMRVEGALLLGEPPGTLPLELRFGKAKRKGLGKVLVPVEVGIPVASLTLLPQDGRYVAEVEIRVTVMDHKGYRSDVPMGRITLSGDHAPREGERFWYETTLLIRRRDHTIVVAVYDPLSGNMLSSVGEVSP